MNVFHRIAIWLDIRPNESRKVALSFLGAFLVMSFLILARSMREALYLTTFDITTLPYITATVAVLSVPTVGTFGRVLSRYSPKRVLMGLLVILSAGLALLWAVAASADSNVGLETTIVAFYLWTALGTLLVTSGFWVVTSEHFPVRGAKRLFGLVGAGGTAGAMITGSSLVWLTRQFEFIWLAPGLILLLLLFMATQQFLPRLEEAPSAGAERSSLRESLSAAWTSPHLRTVALIVFTVALATTLLDYQFKELASASFTTREDLSAFFGAFYGWTGGVALLLQIFVVARLLAVAGVAWTLIALPLVLLLGSVGMLIVPSLVLVTLVRGADASLRKSIYRSALEVLYVPVPSLLRRKTKTFIDSVVDAIGEGVGAAVIFLWVTLPALPSRYLSVFIIGLSIALLTLSRRMGRHYFATVSQQLQESGERAQVQTGDARLEGRDLLSGTFTRLDIMSLIDDETPDSTRAVAITPPPEPLGSETVEARLESPDLRVVLETLEQTTDLKPSHIPALSRLLARDSLYDRVVVALLTIGDPAVSLLAALLRDENTDFVIRRRIPRLLARMGGSEADDALLDALTANRFEVRYRAAIAAVRRRRHRLPSSAVDEKSIVWSAIRSEVSRGRPVWEMQRLLDGEPEEDDLVSQRVGVRGELSLEHTFRLMSLVLEPEVVRAAFHGIILDDERLRSFSLEYLEQVLPPDVRDSLWPFIGDVSEYRRHKSLRSLNDVVSDLMTTGATLFGSEQERAALKQILEEQED